MDKTFQVLGLFILVLMVACKKKTEVILDPVEPVFGFYYNGVLQNEMAEAFWYEDSVIIVSTSTLQLAFDGINLNQKELSQASFSEAIIEGAYSSNISDTKSGTIQLTSLNEQQNMVSGKFDFDAFDSFSPEQMISIKDGIFESVPLYKVQDPFYKKKGYGHFQQNEIAYRQVSIKRSSEDTLLKIELNHPTNLNFKIEIKETIQPGTYDLKDLSPGDFSLIYSNGTDDSPLNCLASCQIEIEEIDPVKHDISFSFLGNFKDDSGTELIVSEFWVR
jgi:hypothetical protein